MLGITNYGAFILAYVLLLIIPGPGNFALMTSTTKGGIKGGLAASLGAMVGDQVLMWLAVAGVASLLQAYPAAFHAVQWLGGAYLAWMGLKILLAKPGDGSPVNIKPHHYLLQTMLIILFNPKAILFYMAFLPLFIDPVQHLGLITFGFMSLTIVLLNALYCTIVVLLTYCFAERLRANKRVSGALQKLAGMVLIGFGIKVAVN
jgi:leucine efflux protein